MPTYTFVNEEYGIEEDRTVLIADRDKPQYADVEVDGDKKTVPLKRIITHAASISYEPDDPIKKAGSGWNDLLKKIKSGSGRTNTIRTR